MSYEYIKLFTFLDPNDFTIKRRNFSWKNFPVIPLDNTPREKIMDTIKKQVNSWKEDEKKSEPIKGRIKEKIKISELRNKKNLESSKNSSQNKEDDKSKKLFEKFENINPKNKKDEK